MATEIDQDIDLILSYRLHKRFIGEVSQKNEPRLREPGSHAAAIAAASQGAQMLRLHDVAGTAQALEVWRLAVSGEPEKG